MNEIARIQTRYEFKLPSISCNIRPHFGGPKSVRAVEECDRIQKVSGHENRPGMAGCDITLHLHRVYALLQTKLNGQDFVTTAKETLINSEFPQHKDVLPFSMVDKPLKMKKKVKCDFTFFVL